MFTRTLFSRTSMRPYAGQRRLSTAALLATMLTLALPGLAQTSPPAAQTTDTTVQQAGQPTDDKTEPAAQKSTPAKQTPPKSDDAGKRGKREDRKDPERELEEEEDI